MPTIAETLPGFEAVAWYAIVAPPKTPRAIIDKVNADVNEALATPEITGAVEKAFGGSVRRLRREDREIPSGRDRPRGEGDQGGEDRDAVGIQRSPAIPPDTFESDHLGHRQARLCANFGRQTPRYGPPA